MQSRVGERAGKGLSLEVATGTRKFKLVSQPDALTRKEKNCKLPWGSANEYPREPVTLFYYISTITHGP